MKLPSFGSKARMFAVKGACLGMVLLGLGASTPANAYYFSVYRDFQGAIDNNWRCSFPKPNGAYDWANFSPYAPMSVSQPYYDFNLHWDNGIPKNSGFVRMEVPTFQRIGSPDAYYDTGGLGNKAVLQAIYAAALNRGNPSRSTVSNSGGLDPYLSAAEYSDDKMVQLIGYVQANTGITDGGYGSIDQLVSGLDRSINYFLACANNYLGMPSTQIYYSNDFLPNIDLDSFNGLIKNGSVMIVQTNKLIWNATKRAWHYGDSGMYIIKGLHVDNSGSTGTTYTLYDVATGTTKVVTPGNLYTKIIWSSGAVSGGRTITYLDDTNPNYAEAITGFAGVDPLVNRY